MISDRLAAWETISATNAPHFDGGVSQQTNSATSLLLPLVVVLLLVPLLVVAAVLAARTLSSILRDRRRGRGPAVVMIARASWGNSAPLATQTNSVIF